MALLNTDTIAFIEKFGLYMSSMGLSPSASRIIAFLLICEPRYQSAEDVQQRLRLSAGSVSTALSFLQQVGLVRKLTFRDDRRFYYELAPDCWRKLIETRKLQMKQGVALADEGLALGKNNTRLREVRRLYKAFESLLDELQI